MADQLRERARSDLCINTPGAATDPIVWEHSSRVARLTDAIAMLPELESQAADRAGLVAAALYHDAGWVLQLRAGKVGCDELLLRPASDGLRELAADWVMDRLEGIVPPGSLELAARAIRQCNNRQTDLLEAHILADADNLDQIGPQAICLMLRKQRAEGKTLADLVTAWQRQEEYHYWQARIKEGFWFASVRSMAQRRLDALRRFMKDLRASIHLEDLAMTDGAAKTRSDSARPAR